MNENNQTEVVQRVIETITNIKLIGVEKITADKVITTFNATCDYNSRTNKVGITLKKEIISREVEKLSFALNEIQKEQIERLRKKGIPFFLLKTEGKYYYTRIPRTMSFVSSDILGHICTIVGNTCKRFSSFSDEKGGCKKVRDMKKRIETYDWITEGYEVDNTTIESFVVAKCSNYK